ncbi:hypothetical protein GCM10012275_39220 [Longimycelium tulufanense]|uniref:Uncharacterized protein n=1 Tax=Longimycelium tulufanense TaxID=907463 RepID=A0A8J3CGC8_9PSEU|nr:hypothetical protein [Longimycelium tulufanense]GGM64790.1 hypothetical protein GCM10012275_39220 [Longimycelium tulufanense]
MVVRRMPRIHEVIIPVLREKLPEVMVTSWVPDVDYRQWPILNVRRLGGLARDVEWLDRPVIELTAYSRDGLVACERLFLDARQVLWGMVENQTLTEAGYLHSMRETMGPTQFDSPFDDSWRVQGLIQLGLRPARMGE